MSSPITAEGTVLSEALQPVEGCMTSFGVYLDSWGCWIVNHLYYGQSEIEADGTRRVKIYSDGNDIDVVAGVAWTTDTKTGDSALAEKIWKYRDRISSLLLESPYAVAPAAPQGVVFAGRIQVEFAGDKVSIRDYDRPDRVHVDSRLLDS